MSNKRNEFFDVCKGIGIFCVYYGHTALWGTLPSRMVFSFHMPLFFVLSGIFFDIRKIPDFGSLVRKVWRNLLLPYCFFVVVGSVLKLDLTISKWCSNPFREVERIIHGEGSNAIWFLVCLAVVQIFAWCFCKTCEHFGCVRAWWLLLLISLGGGHLVYRNVPQEIVGRLPFMLASVPAGMFFFSIGILAREPLFKFSLERLKTSRLMLFQLLIFAFFCFVNMVYRSTFDIRAARFNVKVLPSCFLGLFLVFLVAKMIIISNAARKAFSAVGERSLFLFAFELPLSYLVCKMTGGVFVAYPMWKAPHPLFMEPLRMSMVLGLAWLFSYPASKLLGKLRNK